MSFSADGEALATTGIWGPRIWSLSNAQDPTELREYLLAELVAIGMAPKRIATAAPAPAFSIVNFQPLIKLIALSKHFSRPGSYSSGNDYAHPPPVPGASADISFRVPRASPLELIG